MVSRIFAAALFASLLFTGPLAAQVLVTLPANTTLNDITPDGLVVVGSQGGNNGLIWRWKQDPTPTIVPGGTFVAVSDDGKVVAGNTTDPLSNKSTAAIWTQAGGWQPLGGLSGGSCDSSLSTAYDISGDGTIVVGLGWPGCDGRGFRWTAATGMQELQGLASGHNRCSAISGDGLTMGGFAQGNFSRTPAFWGPFVSGAVIDPNLQGEVYALTEDGSKSVGTLFQDPTQGFFDAFVRDNFTGVITNIGSLHTDWAAAASDLSEDASVIVGFDYIGLARQAWVWTSADGIKSLNDRVAALGLTGAPEFVVCTAVSNDGNVIVGNAAATPGGFASNGFIVQLHGLVGPYGSGTPGCAGPVLLAGTPAPTVGEQSYTLVSMNAPPNALGLWLINDAPDALGSDPFGLGVKMHINLFAGTVLFTPNGTSDASGVGIAPVPIPNTPSLAGATFYAQVLWAWPAGSCTTNYPQPFGLASSNGLAITIFP